MTIYKEKTNLVLEDYGTFSVTHLMKSRNQLERIAFITPTSRKFESMFD